MHYANRMTGLVVHLGAILLLLCWAMVNSLYAAASEEVRISRINRPPNIADFVVEGNIQESLGLAHVATFTQQQPSDGLAATGRTDVYLGYDAARLYAIWVCSDRNRASIRAQFGPRDSVDPDQIYKDDFVELTIDTFHDKRHAFSFASNPLGIQTDALWTEDSQSRD